ncbi:hypothetical protein JYU34_002047 [Plutella xylostella]|uniref:Uncharacterized protein n=1 Tax=Plutella xylostella TaxID=51655 RepID=A0ABQ7R5G3_PLUXY|nr:hypothetical protein JYU34_002047 [Plutella xylostella]
MLTCKLSDHHMVGARLDLVPSEDDPNGNATTPISYANLPPDSPTSHIYSVIEGAGAGAGSGARGAGCGGGSQTLEFNQRTVTVPHPQHGNKQGERLDSS